MSEVVNDVADGLGQCSRAQEAMKHLVWSSTSTELVLVGDSRNFSLESDQERGMAGQHAIFANLTGECGSTNQFGVYTLSFIYAMS
jgi:hypothetical protein